MKINPIGVEHKWLILDQNIMEKVSSGTSKALW